MKSPAKTLGEFLLALLLLYVLGPAIETAAPIVARLAAELVRSPKADVTMAITRSPSRDAVVNSAYAYIDTPIGNGRPSGTVADCSDLTQRVFSENGIPIGRSTAEQFGCGSKVYSMEHLVPGDLVFFSDDYSSQPQHVGIYVGGRKMVHASSRCQAVVCERIDSDYYRGRFLWGRRIAFYH